jgi:hypothetical protein
VDSLRGFSCSSTRACARALWGLTQSPAGLEGASKKSGTTEASLEAPQRDALLDVLIERRPYRRGHPAVQHRRRGVRHPLLLVQMQLEVLDWISVAEGAPD